MTSLLLRMNYKNIRPLALLLALFAVHNAFSQTPIWKDAIIDGQSGGIRQLPLKPPGVKGSVYLNEEWQQAGIYLKNTSKSADAGAGEMMNVPVKFDLQANQFEINTTAGVKVLPGDRVEKFEWQTAEGLQTEVYINCEQFSYQDTRLIGFCQVHSDGKMMLVSRIYIETIKANYNVALSVGNNHDTLVKKEKLCLIKDGKLIDFDKKSLLSQMSDKEKQVNQYVKDNHLKLGKEDHVKQLVEYYNSI